MTAIQLLAAVCAVFLGLTPCQAAEARFNGGNVIVCSNPKPGQKKVELGDLFESRVLNGIALDLGPADWTFSQKAGYLLSRFETFDELRFMAYSTVVAGLLYHTDFKDGGVKALPDTYPAVVAKDCQIRPVAILIKGDHRAEDRFEMDKTLWSLMDEDSKAVLLLHLTILQDAIRMGQHDSTRTRSFLVALASPGFSSMTQKSYSDLLSSAGLKYQGPCKPYAYSCSYPWLDNDPQGEN